MSGFIGRHTASRISAGNAGSARINAAEELISTPWEYQMLLEGRVFVAGTGLEEAGVAGIAAIDPETPVFGLVAPAGDVVIIPLFVRLYYDTEGAAAATIHWYYAQKDLAAYAAGTVLPALNCLGGTNPRSAQGRLLHTLTSVTDITAAQNVVIDERAHILDNWQSVEAVTTLPAGQGPGGENSFQQLWKPLAPFGLYQGSAIYLNAIDATARYNVAAAWIEVPSAVYLP